MKFGNLVIGIILVGLFFFSLTAFAVQTQTNNPTNSSLQNDAVFNSTYNSIQSSLITTSGTANTTKNVLETDTPTAGFGSLIFFSIVGIGKLLSGTTIGMYNIIEGAAYHYIGISPIILGAISAILLITIVLAAYRLYKVGE